MEDMERQVDVFTSWLLPTKAAEHRRVSAFEYIRARLQEKLGKEALVCLAGSSPLKTYLPDSDLDVVVFAKKYSHTCALLQVNQALCNASMGDDEVLRIWNVSFVKARTNVVSCTIQNISIDITENQTASVGAAVLMEEADRIIGVNHLFKRSFIVIKAWCKYESGLWAGPPGTQTRGLPILGSKVGMLSSYALAVMVLHLFNSSQADIQHPLHALSWFLYYYGTFDWNLHMLRLEGPCPLPYPQGAGNREPPQVHTRFRPLVERIQGFISHKVGSTFPVKYLNIQDPLCEHNNLGFNISSLGLATISRVLRSASSHLGMLLNITQIVAPEIIGDVYASQESTQQNKSQNKQHGKKKVSSAVRAALVSPTSAREINTTLLKKKSVSLSQPVHTPMLPDSQPTVYSPKLPDSLSKTVQIKNPSFPADQYFHEKWFLCAFFPTSTSMYGNGSGFRPDLLEHPRQQWNSELHKDGKTTNFNSTAEGESILAGDANALWLGLSVAAQILSDTQDKSESEQISGSGTCETTQSETNPKGSKASNRKNSPKSQSLQQKSTTIRTPTLSRRSPQTRSVGCSAIAHITSQEVEAIISQADYRPEQQKRPQFDVSVQCSFPQDFELVDCSANVASSENLHKLDVCEIDDISEHSSPTHTVEHSSPTNTYCLESSYLKCIKKLSIKHPRPYRSLSLSNMSPDLQQRAIHFLEINESKKHRLSVRESIRASVFGLCIEDFPHVSNFNKVKTCLGIFFSYVDCFHSLYCGFFAITSIFAVLTVCCICWGYCSAPTTSGHTWCSTVR